MFKMNKGGVKAPMKGNSAKTFMPVGSGSRPGTSKIAIDTSAPAVPHRLDSRAPSSFLK